MAAIPCFHIVPSTPLAQATARSGSNAPLAGVVAHAHFIATRRILIAIALSVAFVVSAQCASAGIRNCASRAARTHDVLPVEPAANWEPVDDRSILIWTGNSTRAYLVRLRGALAGLTDAPIITIRYTSTDRYVSACGTDAVVIPGGGSATIASIRLLTREQTAELDPQDSAPRIATTRV